MLSATTRGIKLFYFQTLPQCMQLMNPGKIPGFILNRRNCDWQMLYAAMP